MRWTLKVKPRSTPAMSPITGHPSSHFGTLLRDPPHSSQPSTSGLFHDPILPPERKGKSKRAGGELCCGDWLMPAPWGASGPLHRSSDMYLMP